MRANLWMFATLLCTSCATEYEVNQGPAAAGSQLPSVGGDLPGGPPGGGHPGGSGNGGQGTGNGGGNGQGPWGNIDPGSLPDVYFALAIGTSGSWSEGCMYGDAAVWDCCCWYDADDCDGDGLCDMLWWPEDPYMMGGGYYGGTVEYVVVDLRGHVVAEFTPPDTHFEQGMVQHLELRPAGPGQFLAVTWMPELDSNASNGEVPSMDDTDGDGLYDGGFANQDPANRWLAWSGDAVTHQSTRLVKGDDQQWYTGDARVIGTSESLDLRGDWEPRVHLDVSATQPDELLAWSGASWCHWDEQQRRPDQIQAAQLFDAEVPVMSWSPEAVLPWHTLTPGTQSYPWAMQTGSDLDGSSSVLLGVGQNSCTTGLASAPWIQVWSPDSDASWGRYLPESTAPLNVSYSGIRGGAVLHVSRPAYVNAPTMWTVYGPDWEQGGLLPPDKLAWRVGPLLDPAGPSFAVLATDPEEGLDELSIVHGGNVVWTIHKLKFGLEERGVHILDAVMLPPVP